MQCLCVAGTTTEYPLKRGVHLREGCLLMEVCLSDKPPASAGLVVSASLLI